MSFGWSVGDLIAAINLLTKIGGALREAGGASSEYQDATSFLSTLQITLENLKSLDTISIDVHKVDNLRQQCEHIQVPLATFLDNVNRRYEASLGSLSQCSRLLCAPRKIQWALYTSKKIRHLQERIAVPMAAVNMLLGLQTIESILKIPEQMQTSMSSAIKSTLPGHLEPIIRSVHDVLEVHHDKCTESQGLNSQQIIKANGDGNKMALNAIQALDISSRAASSKLQVKLEEIGTAVVLVHQELCSLPRSRREIGVSNQSIELQAIENIFRSLWLLISSLQQLIRALLMIAAPYLLAMYKSSVGRLMLAGDHFTFEDALGRMTRLPCSQFQEWNNFYDFLTESFANSPGLSYVVGRHFRVLNGYNNVVIHQGHWNAAIQPKAKMVMSMLLQHRVLGKACPLSSCKGVVALGKTATSGNCSVCNRFVTLERPIQDDHLPQRPSSPPVSTSLNWPLDVTIHSRESTRRHAKTGQWYSKMPPPQTGIPKAFEAIETSRRLSDADISSPDVDIAAFKRVSVVPTEKKKNVLGSSSSQREDANILTDMLYAWSPRRTPILPTSEILEKIQGASLYSEFMDILATHESGHFSILKCSHEILALFPPESHYELNGLFQGVFESGFGRPLLTPTLRRKD
ncbi:hypothetical protein IFR05_004853 [Cadophora sp. M221]|nr:hypothetical protein IFR05_004853 [Cadophora sp. M221]